MTRSSIKVMVFGTYFPPAFRAGGPVKTLNALVKQAPDGFDVRVLTRDADLGETDPMPVTRDTWIAHGASQVRYITNHSIRSWWNALRAARAFKPDIVYCNSFFDPRFSILPQLLARVRLFGRPAVVVSPSGEFARDALAMKHRKKAAYLRLYSVTGMSRQVRWHASNSSERDDIMHVMGARSPVIVRENLTALPQTATLPSRSKTARNLRAVHLARLAPIKGLAVLLDGLGMVDEDLSLDVFGPVEDLAYAKRCRELAERLPSKIEVRFNGPVEPDDVRRCFLSLMC